MEHALAELIERCDAYMGGRPYLTVAELSDLLGAVEIVIACWTPIRAAPAGTTWSSTSTSSSFDSIDDILVVASSSSCAFWSAASTTARSATKT